MTTLRLVTIAVAAGALAGGAISQILVPPPPDLAAERLARDRLSSEVATLSRELNWSHRELAAIRAELEQWKWRLEKSRDPIGTDSESGELAWALSAHAMGPLGEDPRTALEGAFARLGSGGFLAVQGPLGFEIVDRIRALGEDGTSLLLEELTEGSEKRRFVATVIAERLASPQLIGPLATAALEDDAPLVRRMASHALATMSQEAAGDALIRILDGDSRDDRVRLNAWLGLAALRRPEALERFGALLDGGGAEMTADFILDASLQIDDPYLHPAFREAYDHPQVTSGLRIAILRTLAQEDSGQWRGFIRSVAEDADSPESLREVARGLTE